MQSVLLLSGGVDSATALAYYTTQGYELTCLTFNYGQKNQYEIETANFLAESYKVTEHLIIEVDSQIFNSASSLNSEKNVEEFDSYNANKNFVPTTYLPSRNIIFLSFATGVAESRNIKNIIFSANKNDSADYPDCSSDFVGLFNKTINVGTHIGKTDSIRILTPFIDKSKSEIIELGLSLNVD